MKKTLLTIITALGLCLNAIGITVFDATNYYAKIHTAQADMAEQLVQSAHMVAQVRELVAQSQKIQRTLDLLGDPSRSVLLKHRDLQNLLRELPLSKSGRELVDSIDVNSLIFSTHPVYGSISRRIELGGVDLGERDVSAFRNELPLRQSLQHYHQTKETALSRRQQVRAHISATLQQLEDAKTTSEVQKLAVMLQSLNAEYANINESIHIAAIESQMQFYQRENERRMKKEARIQDQIAAHREGMRKSTEVFKIFNSPTSFE